MSNEAVIKCKIFKGTKFEDEGKIRFIHEMNGTNTIDEGYFDFFDKKEFELHIKPFALPMGMFVDAYAKDGSVFWSNYQEVKDVESISDEEKALQLETLKAEYLKLKGEEAKGNWGIPKLTAEIKILKEN